MKVMEGLFILHSKYDTVRRTVLIKDNKATGLIDIIKIENGEGIRYLHLQLWRELDNTKPLLSELLKIDYLAPAALFSVEQSSILKLNIIPGNYYPRIYRPFYHDQYNGLTSVNENRISHQLMGELKYPECIPNNRDAVLLSINQLALLKSMLIGIFNNIYPSIENFKSYGHTIKNLLVLGCIEVEAHLQAIMIANKIDSTGKFYTTGDYVKLKDILQLDKYSISFNFYKEIKNITPFKNWDSNSPTQTISWYNSYNKIKHDGDDAFNQASLENVISAISAIVILIYAQFGKNIPYWKEEIGLFFEVKNTCVWAKDDLIIPPFEGEKWEPIFYQV